MDSYIWLCITIIWEVLKTEISRTKVSTPKSSLQVTGPSDLVTLFVNHCNSEPMKMNNRQRVYKLKEIKEGLMENT